MSQIPETTDSTEDITRFLQLASSGRSIKGSPAERAAHKLCKAIDHLGDDIMLLDRQTLSGFFALCELAAGPFDTCAQKAATFRLIQRTAIGKLSPR